MAKAVLVIDMPGSCDMCDMCDFVDGEKTLYCGVLGVGEEVTDYISCRPDWCPLQKLPDREEELPTEKYLFGGLGKAFVSGCNACLDAIENK